MNLFKNRLFIGFLCIILAAIIGFVAVPLVNNFTSQTVEVVCVAQDIDMGTAITSEMLQIVEVGKLNLPEDYATKTSQVIGLYATVDFKKGDVVFSRKVTGTLVLPQNKVRQMNPGEKAFAIKIGNAYLGKLLPNNIVTFYEYDGDGNAKIVPELQYVSVVVTTTADGYEILTANQVSGEGKPLQAENAMFILNSKQATKLFTLQHSGNNSFSIALAYSGNDEQTIQSYIMAQTSFLNSLDSE